MLNIRLREERERKGLTQQEMADYLNVNRTTYCKYETGDSKPDYAILDKIANFFGVSIDYLLGRINERRVRMITLTEFFKNHVDGEKIREIYNNSTPEQQQEFRRRYNIKEQEIASKQSKWIEIKEKADRLGLSPEDIENYLNMIEKARQK